MVDRSDFLRINRFKWRVMGSGNNFYAVREVNSMGKRWAELMHRVVMEKKIKRKLKKEEYIDHINGNGLDNRRCNLRVCNQSQNLANSRIRKDNKSGFKGIYYDKSRKSYQAYVNMKGKRYRLGRFKDIKEAIEKRNIKYKELFGEFAKVV